MKNQDEYIKAQEQLLENFKNADAISQRRVAVEIFLLYMRKEAQLKYEVDKEILPNQDLDIVNKPNKERVTEGTPKPGAPIKVSAELITVENMDDYLTCQDANGNSVDLKEILKDDPKALQKTLQKICDAVNYVTEARIREGAKNIGFNVQKQINGNKIDFELTDDPNSSLDAVSNRVKIIQEDLHAMKQNDDTSSTKPTMTSLPDSTPSHADQDSRTAIMGELGETDQQLESNGSDDSDKPCL